MSDSRAHLYATMYSPKWFIFDVNMIIFLRCLRDKRDSSETELPFPKLVPVTENGRILEDREEMLIEELKTAKAMLDKLQ